VILSDFSEHLTNDLNPEIPSCLLEESEQDQQCSLFAVAHPANPQPLRTERCRNVMYIVLS
jgi:hypothetical protein